MRIPSDHVESMRKEAREFKDRRARDELAKIKRPDELTRLQGEVARLRLALSEVLVETNFISLPAARSYIREVLDEPERKPDA